MKRTVNLVDSKSLLAKLMANENITVLHENLPTAYFDTKERTLHCPIWKDMTGAIYDLLMGHEIGHALNTPPEGWHDAVFDGCKQRHTHTDACADMNFKDFLNVCEDARIEKKIKREFPGLKKSFAEAYKHFWDNDFFKVKNLPNIDDLNLIDRINLFFKVGAHVPINFSTAEQKYVDRLEKVEDWSDVVTIAREIYNFTKTQENKVQTQEDMKQAQNGQGKFSDEQKQENDPGKKETSESAEGGLGKDQGSGEVDSGDDEESDLESEKDSEEEENNQQDSEDSDKIEEDEEDEEEGETTNQQPNSGGTGDKHDKRSTIKPQSLTDKAFRESEKQLVTRGSAVANVEMPIANLENIVYDLETVVSKFELASQKNNIAYEENSAKVLAFILNKNKGYVNLLFKEFEMRKNAKQYYRAQTHRSGELDTQRLARYHHTNDIFKRITEMPKGKNHAMLFFLDMSGSMDHEFMSAAIEQMLMLIWFCNKAKIPFEVYGFADNNQYVVKSGSKFSNGFRQLKADRGGFHLRTLMSSFATKPLQRRAMRMLAYHAANESRGYLPEELENLFRNPAAHHNGLETGGTPLSECIIASRKIIESIKHRTRADIVNVLYFSDGDGHQMGYPLTVRDDIVRQKAEVGRVIMSDPITKRRIMVETNSDPRDRNNWMLIQNALVKMVKEITGCRHLGYYITADASDIKGRIGKKFTSEMDENLRNMGFCSAPVLGFDNYYYLTTKFVGLSKKNVAVKSVESTVSVKTNTAVKQFTLEQNHKKAARVVLSKFAQEIATNDGLERLEG